MKCEMVNPCCVALQNKCKVKSYPTYEKDKGVKATRTCCFLIDSNININSNNSNNNNNNNAQTYPHLGHTPHNSQRKLRARLKKSNE